MLDFNPFDPSTPLSEIPSNAVLRHVDGELHYMSSGPLPDDRDEYLAIAIPDES